VHVYGRWKVLGIGTRRGYLECVCACGTVKQVFGSNIRKGKSKSCGCLRADVARAGCLKRNPGNTFHKGFPGKIFRHRAGPRGG